MYPQVKYTQINKDVLTQVLEHAKLKNSFRVNWSPICLLLSTFGYSYSLGKRIEYIMELFKEQH